MDTYEATKIVMSRIQTLDPENASKIMGYILIQDQGEKEMIRLAFGPETLLLSHINQAKACLGLPSNTPSSNPSNPMMPNTSFPQTSPRIMIPKNGFHTHLSNPSSPAAAFQRNSPRPFSYAAALNTGNTITTSSNNGSSSPSLHFYGGSNNFSDGFLSGSNGVHLQHQVHDFFDESNLDPIMSPSGRSDSLVFPYGEDVHANGGHSSPHPHPFHRRSCSVNDAAFLGSIEEGGGGFGWRPCMYFARGFCKNGGACKFLHSDVNGGGECIDVGSPSGAGSGLDDLLRIKAIQQRRFAAMAAGGHQPLAYNKCMDVLSENPRLAATALMMGDDLRKFNRFRPDSNDFSPMGLGSSSQQIYLTFPADSSFKEDDVSSYFSMFGPVQDVRIPYQQKRMFGFVTFVYAETVNLILAKGNPHFVCDSRVLVKPYKEKGKVAEKKQQMERGDYSGCLSPSGLDSREHFDLPFGSRMLMSTQELMLRRKLEQEAELQHAIELQNRRMMNLKLMDLKNQNHNHNLMPNFPISSPRQSQLLMNQKFTTSSNGINQEQGSEGTEVSTNNNTNGGDKQTHISGDDSDLPESMEHALPDNFFSSPTKLAAESKSIFSQASADNNISVKMTPSNENPELANMASLKSCYFQMPRFQEVVEMQVLGADLG